MKRKKICIVTGSRAEWGLLSSLARQIKRHDKVFELQIIATGAHLSPEFGFTYREIEADGFKINRKVDMHLSGDSEVDITKSIGIGVIGFGDAFRRVKPNLVVLIGDRFEIFAAAAATFIAKIPIAHIGGGEVTEGAIDEAFRHSITKMSRWHFVSAKEYRNRVIQLGESPNRVFNVGALNIDNIKNTTFLNKKILEKELKFKFGKKTLLVTFHPVTLENHTEYLQVKEILKALDYFPNSKIIFTQTNADPHGRTIIKLIKEYVKNNYDRAVFYVSLGRLKYLSILRYVDIMIGNSSSGITEFPSFKKPTVNIGDRQRGRIKADSVIDCKPESEDIRMAISKSFSPRFRKFCRRTRHPFGNGQTAEKIVNILKKEIGEPQDLKKSFYNIPVRNV